MATIKPKRGTRAQIDAAALAGTLVVDEICFITDEEKIAVCTGTSTFITYSADAVGGGPEPWSLSNSNVTGVSDVYTIDLSLEKHRVIEITGASPFTISFSNWSTAPITDMVMVELINGGLATGISFPGALKFILPNGALSTNFNDLEATLNSSGTDFFMFWSKDQGTNIFARLMR